MGQWNLIKVVGSVLAVLLPFCLTYYIFQKGEGAQRDIKITEQWISTSQSFLKDLDGRVELKIDDKDINNISIGHYAIENVGHKEISPIDFHETLGVEVKEPWEIIGVSTDFTRPDKVELKWNQIDTRRAELEPMLINPEDRYRVLVYLTNNEFDANADEPEEPKLTWTARITNLHQLRIDDRKYESANFWVEIYFTNFDAIIFLLISFALSVLTAYLVLLNRDLSLSKIQGIVTVVIAGVLSILSSTIITSFLVGNSVAKYNHWSIWLMCGLHLMVISLSCIAFLGDRKKLFE